MAAEEYQSDIVSTGSDNNVSTVDKELAGILLDEYEKELWAGKSPDPEQYISQYWGHGREQLVMEFNLVTLLVVSARERTERSYGPDVSRKVQTDEQWKRETLVKQPT